MNKSAPASQITPQSKEQQKPTQSTNTNPNINSNPSNLKLPPPKINCPCKINEVLKKQLKLCWSCNTYQHESCIKEAAKMINYQCPRCQIHDMDPYIKTLFNILPSAIINYQPADLKMFFQFKIAQELVKIIEEYNRGGAKKNPMYIFIRCLRLDDEGFEHHWPLNFSTYLNGICLKNLILPKFPPRSKSRVDYPIAICMKSEDMNPNPNFHNLNKEHFFPIDKVLVINPNLDNVLEFRSDYSKNDNDKFSYVISIDLVEILKDPDDVIRNIPKINDPKELSRFFNKNGTENSDDILSSEKVILIDCYTRSQRIKIPARSINCLHLSVFDLKYYLAINRKNKSYNCPLCKKKSTRLYIDGFIKSIMDENIEIEDILLSQNYELEFGKKNSETKESNKKSLPSQVEKTCNNFATISQELNSAFIASQISEKSISSPNKKNDDVEMIDILEDVEMNPASDNKTLISNNSKSVSSPMQVDKDMINEISGNVVNPNAAIIPNNANTNIKNINQKEIGEKINSIVRCEPIFSSSSNKTKTSAQGGHSVKTQSNQGNQGNNAPSTIPPQDNKNLYSSNISSENSAKKVTPSVQQENINHVSDQNSNIQINTNPRVMLQINSETTQKNTQQAPSSNKKSANSTPTFQVASTINSNTNSNSNQSNATLIPNNNKQAPQLTTQVVTPGIVPNTITTNNTSNTSRKPARNLILNNEEKTKSKEITMNLQSTNAKTASQSKSQGKNQVLNINQVQSSFSNPHNNNPFSTNKSNPSPNTPTSNVNESKNKMQVNNNTSIGNNQNSRNIHATFSIEDKRLLMTQIRKLVSPNQVLELVESKPDSLLPVTGSNNNTGQDTAIQFNNFYKKISGRFIYPMSLNVIKKKGHLEIPQADYKFS